MISAEFIVVTGALLPVAVVLLAGAKLAAGVVLPAGESVVETEVGGRCPAKGGWPFGYTPGMEETCVARQRRVEMSARALGAMIDCFVQKRSEYENS